VGDEYWRVVPRLRSNIVERMTEPPKGCRKVVLFAWKVHGDFDRRLLATLPEDVTVRRARLLPLATRVLFSKAPRVLELPEPMWYRYWPSTSVLAAVARIRGSRRPIVASVAMENFPARRGLTVRQLRLPRMFDPLLRRMWMRSVGAWDAFYFMSSAAEQNYRDVVPNVIENARVERGLELMPKCPSCDVISTESRNQTVLFAAQFIERKGIDVLLDAWSQVSGELGGWTLRLAGFGPLAPQVGDWAATRPEVTVSIAPAREELHDALRRAAILVLPSREVDWWREQIGYPILEGLSHGCAIVTTEDTGLASWLQDHGHEVVRAADPVALAEALRRMCTRPDRPTVIDDLPQEDTRLVAERWFASLASEA
jgi:glycosyltransferase involved in cell wall biosynthesis